MCKHKRKIQIDICEYVDKKDDSIHGFKIDIVVTDSETGKNILSYRDFFIQGDVVRLCEELKLMFGEVLSVELFSKSYR